MSKTNRNVVGRTEEQMARLDERVHNFGTEIGRDIKEIKISLREMNNKVGDVVTATAVNSEFRRKHECEHGRNSALIIAGAGVASGLVIGILELILT
jgi:hypothetical protein